MLLKVWVKNAPFWAIYKLGKELNLQTRPRACQKAVEAPKEPYLAYTIVILTILCLFVGVLFTRSPFEALLPRPADITFWKTRKIYPFFKKP